MQICTHETKNLILILRVHRPFLHLYNQLSRSTMLLIILTMEEEKGEEEEREAEVVMPIEVVITVIIWPVVSMMGTRGPTDMPKVARIMAARAITTMVIRISINRLINLLSISNIISNGNSNSNRASSFKETNSEAVALVTMEAEIEAAVIDAWAHLITSTGWDTGKQIAPHSWCVSYAMDLT